MNFLNILLLVSAFQKYKKWDDTVTQYNSKSVTSTAMASGDEEQGTNLFPWY